MIRVRTGEPKNCSSIFGSGRTVLAAPVYRPALETTKPNIQRIKEFISAEVKFPGQERTELYLYNTPTPNAQ
jgi:hypothetical protein